MIKVTVIVEPTTGDRLLVSAAGPKYVEIRTESDRPNTSNSWLILNHENRHELIEALQKFDKPTETGAIL